MVTLNAMDAHEDHTHLVSTASVTVDREARPKFWLAAYTRPKSEKKAASELAKSGLETYVPVQTMMKQWSDRKKKVDVVVIPMVIFIRCTVEDVSAITRHPLVLKLISMPGRKTPARIPDNQIAKLKFILNEYDVPVSFEPIAFKELDKVKVIRGRLAGLEGEVLRVDDKTRLVISLDFLGGATLSIDMLDLELSKA